MDFNFKKALKRIAREEFKGNNPIPDILSFSHLKCLYEDKLFNILESLFNDYESANSPTSLLKIDVPKPNFTIRPMSHPETKDWILYEAIVESISANIARDKNICKRSFSYLNFLPDTEKENNWIKFDDKCREFYTLGCKYAVVADLTGYYENISLSELKKRVVNYLEGNDDNNKLVNVLHKMLSKWSDERVSGYGLPQGPPASAFLADIYLDHIDNKMETKYENYRRYMDDIRIFCKTEIEAKKALKDLIIALRGMKLNINAKKTRIFHEKDIESNLFDPFKSSLNLIESIFKSRNISNIKIIIPTLVEIFENSFLNDPFEKRHLSFSLYRLSTLQSSGFELDTSKILSLIKENFISKPHHTGLFCYFLTLFPKDKDIVNLLISFLKSEHNIYEWQEVKVLQSLLKFCVSVANNDIKFFIESAKDSNKHFATRAFYFLLVGKYGTNRDRDFIVDLYNNSLDHYLKTFIILAVQELGHASRKDFYARIKNHEGDNEITKFINYVKSLKHPLYYLDIERPKLEHVEETEPSPY